MKKDYLIIIIALLLLVVAACKKEEIDQTYAADYDGSVAFQWFRLECTLVKETPGFFPPQAARAFAYTGIALYESVAQGWSEPVSLAGQLQAFDGNKIPKIEQGKEYHWDLAANAALAEITRKMFEKALSPENLEKINSLENKLYLEKSTKEGSVIDARSSAFGKAIANAVYEYSTTDGGHEQYLDPFQLPYTWPEVSGAWVPTGAVGDPLSPEWQNNRPFLSFNITEAQPLPHIPYSTDTSSEFYREALSVYHAVTRASAEEKEIARFWSDDPFNTCTPAGHTFNVLTQLLEENHEDLGTCAIAYARMGIAENDAFIACWKTKYDYFLIRPVTYIRRHIDPGFTTLIGTPPFPSYTSGHATEAAAASRIFTAMFTDGDGNYPFTDRTQIQFGFAVRNYDNFNEMAEECANSRLYGGIHYPMDNLNGLKMGRAVGDNVLKRIDWPE